MKEQENKSYKVEVKEAIKLHEQKNEIEALKAYQHLMDKGCTDVSIYVNGGAILRKRKEYDEAIKFYRRGLYYNDKDERIWGNYANTLDDKGEAELAIYAFRKSFSLKHTEHTLIALSKIYAKAGYTAHAIKIAKSLILASKTKVEAVKVLTNLFEAIGRVAGAWTSGVEKNEEWSKVLEKIEVTILEQDTATISDKILRTTFLAQAWINMDQLERARERFKDTLVLVKHLASKGEDLKSDFTKQLNALGWNLSIYLLKKGKLKEGWDLYDNGLRVEAEGKQKWQRSLRKPIDHRKVPVWKGESLTNRSLILLGEQGIGDTMMFSSLIPMFQKMHKCKIYLMPGNRLVESYKRFAKEITIMEESEVSKKIDDGSLRLDFQLPVGSIPSRGFDKLELYKPTQKVIAANTDLANKKKSEYLNQTNTKKFVIGISWQGGGKTNRIKMKSIGLGDLLPLFKIENCTFVSLQYGDDGSTSRNSTKAGTSIIHDDDFDPVLRIDEWFSQFKLVMRSLLWQIQQCMPQVY